MYVAHAMGEIDGCTYTNSLEAFLYNYKLGFRVFEVDMILSEDLIPIARHAGAHMFDILNQEIPERILKNQKEPYTSYVQGINLTRNEFKKLLIYKKYTPIDIYDLIKLLQDYPDVVFLVDQADTFFPLEKRITFFTELVNLVCHVNCELLERIIPNVSDQEFYRILNSLYPFKNVIWVLAKETDKSTFDFIKQNNKISILFIADTLAETTDYIQKGKEMGRWTYVVLGKSKEQIERLKAKGADGFYVDKLFE